jgi:hypothetical protein
MKQFVHRQTRNVIIRLGGNHVFSLVNLLKVSGFDSFEIQ